MKDLIALLHEGGHSLVVSNGKMRAFDGRGVGDIYRLYCNDPGFLRGADVADKVIGKGAAAVMVMGGVRKVYADVISESGLALLLEAGVGVTYGRKVDHIINRQGTGICPVEALCADCQTAASCMPLIDGFVRGMGKDSVLL